MRIIHLAVGQCAVGDVKAPVVYALAEDGLAYCFDTTGKTDHWKALPTIPDPPGWVPPSTTVLTKATEGA